LKNKIHQYGSTYIFKDLVKNRQEKIFSTKYFKDYLTDKYKKFIKICDQKMPQNMELGGMHGRETLNNAPIEP